MKMARGTFNSASYGLSHLRHDLLRTVSMISTLSITIAFLLLISSLYFGMTTELSSGDERKGILEGTIPGSLDMYQEFQIDDSIPEEARTTLMNWLFLTSFLIFVVALFIIYNTMAIAVEERRAEIGVLRSVGFSSREVMRIFLAEGAFIGLISWVIAVFLGMPLIVNLSVYLIDRGEQGVFFVQPTIPYELTLLSLVLSVALCLGSTYLATKRSVLMSPVDMLRHRD
ncbi:MAG: FtsX-like permease family protein [Thermoplasmata archaeon]|nr:FtsX-like permease family protein [Thermoplasmata archaeon]